MTVRHTALAVLAALSLGAIFLPWAARADDDDRTQASKRTITLVATGSVKTTPDQVDITTGVTSQAETAKDALAKNTAAMSEVINALKGQGIDPKDIQTTNFSVTPVYKTPEDGQAPQAPIISGYLVSNTVRITVHDVGKLGATLDKIVGLGANDIGAIEFGVSQPDTLKDEARKQAMSKAMATAKLYAEAAGGSLGKVLSITEDEGGGPVARFATAAPMAARAVPIEAGTVSVDARIRVTFELN